MSRHVTLLCTSFLMLISVALPIHAQQATTNCAYTFTSGSGNSYNYLSYCVTANGNIPQITIPTLNSPHLGPSGEGYGICNESPAQNYTDYGVSDTGNWNPATLVSETSTSVKIARTTSDGNWTLSQTITRVSASSSSWPSIKIVMALTNNQPVAKVAYLVRYADPYAPNNTNLVGATGNSAFAFYPKIYGLQLQNVGFPQFGYWRAFAQTVPDGPNACAFAFNDSGGYFIGNGSLVMAYVGAVPAHGTKTVTMTYRGL
jgi:hypothetical protein